MRTMRIAALAAAGSVLVLALAGCGPAIIRVEEPTRTVTKAVAVEGAEALDVELRMAVGEMTVRGGAAGAMDARFEQQSESWMPTTQYSVEGTTGRLRVEQPEPRWTTHARNVWEVRLNDTLPLVLRAKTGVGKSTLELAGLNLRRLDVVGGVGETLVDLGSTARDDVSIDVEGGVGTIVLRLPREAGVRVFGNRDGIGDFTAPGFSQRDENTLYNENYDKPGVKRYDVRITRGVGDVTIEQR